MDLILVMKERLRDQSAEVRALTRQFSIASGLALLCLIVAFVVSPQSSTLSTSFISGDGNNLLGGGGKGGGGGGLSPGAAGGLKGEAESSVLGGSVKALDTTLLAKGKSFVAADVAPGSGAAAVVGGEVPPPLVVVSSSSASSTSAERAKKMAVAAVGAAGGSSSSSAVDGASSSGSSLTLNSAASASVVTAGVFIRFLFFSGLSTALFMYAILLLLNSRFITHYYTATGSTRSTGPWQLTTYVGASPDPQAYRGSSFGGNGGFRAAPVSSPTTSNASSTAVQAILQSMSPSHLFLFPLHKVHFQIPFLGLFVLQLVAVSKLWPVYVLVLLMGCQLITFVVRSRLLWTVVTLATSTR